VPLWRKDKIIGVIQLDSLRLDDPFFRRRSADPEGHRQSDGHGDRTASLNEKNQAEERLRNRLERFHSPQVIEMIIKGNQEPKTISWNPKT